MEWFKDVFKKKMLDYVFLKNVCSIYIDHCLIKNENFPLFLFLYFLYFFNNKISISPHIIPISLSSYSYILLLDADFINLFLYFLFSKYRDIHRNQILC